MQENFKLNLEQINKDIKLLESQLNSALGKEELLTEQILEDNEKLLTYKSEKECYKKSVELIILVQQGSEEKIKKGFETIVTHALQAVHGPDYSFKLEFGKRGNLQEMNFNIITPECETAFDPLETSAGGILDVVSLALRIALMELSTPKINGFLVIDEGFKHLHAIPKEYLQNASKFLSTINEKIGRQIILITGRQELIENADNVIHLK